MMDKIVAVADRLLTVRRIDRLHMIEFVKQYMEVSADVSPWTEENFLQELPGKWELSLSIWASHPVAYCILSKRHASAHIHQFMVARSSRGQGIGAAMMAEVKQQTAESLTLKVDPENARALHFYRSQGFEVCGHDNGYLLLSYANVRRS